MMNILYITPFYSERMEGRYARFHDVISEFNSEEVKIDVFYLYTRNKNTQNTVKANSNKYFFKKIMNESSKYDIVHIVTTGSLSACLVPSFLIKNTNLVIGPTILGYEPIRQGIRWDLKKMSSFEKTKALSDFFIRRLLLSKTSPYSKRFKKIFALGLYHKKLLEYMGVSSNKIVVMPSGVNKKVFKPQGRIERFNSNLSLLYVGECSEYKGYNLLLEALKNIRDKIDFSVVIVGRGEKNIEKVKQFGLEQNVFYEDYMPREELAKFYRGADLYVHPSYNEANPTSMVESLACGTPVLATDGEGFTENKKGENCLFFKRGKSEDLTKKLLQFLENEKTHSRDALKFHTFYDIKKSAKVLNDSYKEIKNELG